MNRLVQYAISLMMVAQLGIIVMLKIAERTPAWRSPMSEISLEEDEVHLWYVSLCQSAATIAQLRQLLSADEQARADQYHFEKDHNHYCVSRGALRTILARYTKRHPRSMRFDYNEFGKPLLAGEQLEFNVSHSASVALIGISKRRSIGVDVEFMRDIDDAPSIVMRYFSLREQSLFQRVPQRERLHAFYNGWTRKEAFTKAVGSGLSLPLDSFDVSLTPGAPAQLLNVDRAAAGSTDWRLNSLTPLAGYKAAVVVSGQAEVQYDYWRWN